ncbi:MAG: hypothetical protein LUG86_07480 [Oscillospiraceae bacterium]|nr:hypothetical protein [Oscillospiraceae bacterium]
MTAVKNITLTVCILSLIYMLVMMLTPDSYKQKVKTVISILTALTIAGGVLNIDFTMDDDNIDANLLYESEYSYNDLILSELDKRLADSILLIYEENGIPVEKISVETNINEDSSIIISKISLTISGDRETYESKVHRVTSDKIGEVKLEISFSEDVDES